MFFYWRHIKDQNKKAKFIAEAIQMMRETNPYNLNYPYMLQMYAGRLAGEFNHKGEKTHYNNAIPKPTVGRLELAENYFKEALSYFRAAYPEDHPTIIACKCDIALTRINRGKFDEAKDYFPFCRKSEETPKKKNLQLIERNNKYAERLEKGLAQ